MRFTYQEYSNFLNQILSMGYSPKFFTDNINSKTLLLRHDIDFSPKKALQLAEIEEQNGIRSTYFFLTTSPLYNTFNEETRDIIFNLIDRGHRIGLHFDSHQYWRSEEPGRKEVEQKVASELRILSEMIGREVNVVSFHNPPEWVFDNTFNGFFNVYARKYFTEIEYVADSNQRWRSEEPLDSAGQQAIQVLTHPVLWGEEDGTKNEFLRQEKNNIVKNISKHIEIGFI